MKNHVFISHTSGRSTDFSVELYSWLKSSPVAGVMEPWHSSFQKNLPVGAYPHQRIVLASSECKYCVSVVTTENIDSPWLNFEAGLFFSKDESENKTKPIVTILCGSLTYNDIKASHPLQPIYSVKANDKKSLLALLVALNKFANSDIEESALERYTNSSLTDELIKKHDVFFSDSNNKLIDAKRGLVF